MDAILAAAAQLDADALHAGWGFLSETPALAQACTAAGVLFIGPIRGNAEILGDKTRARAAASASGVPVTEAAADLQAARALLTGGPIVLKPAGGGGGRGMRVVTPADGLDEAWHAAQAEATRAFATSTISPSA